MGDISLSSAVRQNLLSLQSTADMMSKTQNRLATGLKVNSALDNPNSFFTSQGLNNRANDLTNLLDDMGQGVQTLKAADEGIKGVTKLVEAAKAKANQALQSSDGAARDKYAAEFNDLMGQIEDLAKDSGYNGKNLLGGSGNDLEVNFNEDNSSSLTISAVDYTSTSNLGISDITEAIKGTATITITGETADTLVLDTDSGGQFDNGDVYTVTDADGNDSVFNVSTTTTAADLVSFLNGIEGVSAEFATDGTDSTIEITTDADFTTTLTGDTTTDGTLADQTLNHTSSSWAADSAISSTITQLNGALESLRGQASTFGTNLTVVQNRQDFTKRMVATLEDGAGMLTLADTNQEGANLLALQTRQQLSTTALAMASQADQAVLRLF